MRTMLLVCALATAAVGAEPMIHSDRPNEIAFPAKEARFVRLVIHQAGGTEPCIDELEVYGQDAKRNLALATGGAKATASSLLAGYPQHTVEHLNDGLYGNEFSWIPARTTDEWAQIELAQPAAVSKVVFSRDRNRQYADRVPTDVEVQLSMDGRQFASVAKLAGKAAPTVLLARVGDFAGVVPSPPPPPKLAGGAVVAAEVAGDLKAAAADSLGFANLALRPEAKPAASSVLPNYTIHQIAHLNDGLLGNSHSWISQSDPSWAEIDLGGVYWVYQVAFGSDSSQQYGDRGIASFSIFTAVEHNADSSAPTWTAVYKRSAGPPVQVREEFKFKPVQARWVRIAVESATSLEARIDEIEIFGRKEPIPLEKIGPLPEVRLAAARSGVDEMLPYAFIGEEHAWLKTYGRTDISSRLVPYNGRVKEYPKHVGDDRLPLPPLALAPVLDGNLDDACWAAASRGVARVADPYDFQAGPLVEDAVWAGWKGDDLYVAVRTNRLLSSHLAVVSRTDGEGCGVVAYTKDGLVFNTYTADGPYGTKPDKSTPIEGALDKSLTVLEFRLPLALFPECRERGLRIGLCMGGKNTGNEGRPVHFFFSPLSIAEVAPSTNRTFRVRLAAAQGAEGVKVQGTAAELSDGLSLAPGESKVITLAAERGPLGPQLNLELSEAGGQSYALHLFRYRPLERTLTLLEEMIGRFESRGMDVSAERAELARWRSRQEALLAAAPDPAAEREAFFQARLAKRRLMFRDPDLSPIEKLLFVKRHAYEPSHNYSVMLDSRYRPGGGVYTLSIPRREGRLEPGEAQLTELFRSEGGIARDPMAAFDLSKIYFAYRAKESGYYHVMHMKPDGSGLEQLTDGPFHDYWPCPLPDGGIAFISTRCRSRYLCWRPQAAVLFRMDADGRNITPLSFANLSEWGPSVMSDGRIIWTRSEYIDKGADFSHTLWSIRPDGTKPELVFGNTIIQPNGYANGREVPGTSEICCTLISHFGDLNGPVTLIDVRQGRFNPQAITSITPEVPWPGMWPNEECFRDPVPVARDYFLCAHAPRNQFGLYVLDRYGNREMLYLEEAIGAMCPTLYRKVAPPPVLAREALAYEEGEQGWGQMALADVYQGLTPAVARGTVKYVRVVEEVRAGLEQLPDGEYRRDHEPFMEFYAAPVDKVSGPYGWPSYVAKATWGLAPVEEDGSAHFCAPAGKVLYLQALDKDYNELQRMRSVVQLQPGEMRSCIGCHEDRRHAPPAAQPAALRRPPSRLQAPPWGAGPFDYQKVVQPVWNAQCVRCHNASDQQGIDLSGTLDGDRIPSSYKTLVRQGWVHLLDCGWNSGGNEKRAPLSFGTLQSRLFKVLQAGHYDVKLSEEDSRRIKCWIDMNCPLWPDYIERRLRPGPDSTLTRKN